MSYIRCLVRPTLLSCVLALYATPAAAQDPVISNISKNGYNVINYLNKRAGNELTAGDAEKVKKAVLANKIVDEGEAKLLEYLKSEQSFTIKSRGPGHSDISFTKSVSDEAKTILSLIASTSFDDPIEEQWARGSEADLKALLKLYSGSPKGREKVLGVISAGLKAAYDSGDFQQAKKLMETEITRWRVKLSKLDGSDYRHFKWILFQAAVIADRHTSLSKRGAGTGPPYDYVDGGVPDYLYKSFED